MSLIQKTQEYWEIIGCENMQQYASNYYDDSFHLDEGFLNVNHWKTVVKPSVSIG